MLTVGSAVWQFDCSLAQVMSCPEAVSTARKELLVYEDAQVAAERVLHTALRRRPRGNVTVNIARLFAPRPEETVVRHMERQSGRKRMVSRPNSFVQLSTPSTFVQVVGGFDDLPAE